MQMMESLFLNLFDSGKGASTPPYTQCPSLLRTGAAPPGDNTVLTDLLEKRPEKLKTAHTGRHAKGLDLRGPGACGAGDLSRGLGAALCLPLCACENLNTSFVMTHV